MLNIRGALILLAGLAIPICEASDSQARLVALIEQKRRGPKPAEALNDLASQAMPGGEYGDALLAASAAREEAGKAKDAQERARAENLIGLAHLYLGSYEPALVHFREALRAEETRGDRQKQAQRWNNIGIVHYYQGRYDEAVQSYGAAASIVDGAQGESWRDSVDRLTTANLATVYQKLGQHGRALECYRKMQASGGTLEKREEAQVLSNLGTLQRRMGDVPKAQSLYRDALRLYREDRSSDGEIGTLKNIGILLALDRGDLPGAERQFRQAMRLAQRSSNQRELMQCHLYLGETLLRAGRTIEAAAEWDSAARLAERLGAVEDLWRAKTGAGRLSSHTNPGEALRQFEEAANLLESVRGRLRSASLRSEFLNGRRELFDAWIELTSRSAGDMRAAAVFEVGERARARTLQDRRRQALQGRSDALHQRLTGIAARISKLNTARARTGTDPAPLDREIFTLEQEYLQVEQEGVNSGVFRRAPPDSAATLRASLPGDVAILSYWAAGGTLHRVTLTRESASYKGLPFDEDRRSRVSQWLLDLREGRPWQDGARDIGGWLVEDAPERQKKWVVLTDGILGLIPFEVLLSGPSAAPLIESREISYLPASMLWTPETGHSWRMPWQPGALAIVGDNAGIRLPGDEEWGPLAHASAEATRVAERVGGRSQVLRGAAPEQRRALQERDWAVLHFSTHAGVDVDDPARSRLLLNGGYLFQGEIESLVLQQQPLVTLSACESAVGRVAGPEGVQSLSHAFLSAGAGVTVASLWKVEDRAAAAFMERWYARLESGETAAQALRSVKLEFLRSGNPVASHPSRWAAFVLAGNAQWRLPRLVTWVELVLGVTPALPLGFWLILRRRGKRDRDHLARA